MCMYMNLLPVVFTAWYIGLHWENLGTTILFVIIYNLIKVTRPQNQNGF